MKTTCLKLSSIVTTAGTQIRASIDNDTVGEYADAMQDATNTFPPVVVFHDGNQFILADGFHRVMAASRNGFTDIEAEVRKGTKTDALKHALSANSIHGLKRTNADKRRSVELALAEWPDLSDRNIAELCAVGNKFVGDVREANCVPNTVEATRIGRDGKKRKVKANAVDAEPAARVPDPDWEAKANERIAAWNEAKQSPAPNPQHEAATEVSSEIEVCIADLQIAMDKLQAFDIDGPALNAVADELAKVAKMLRRLAK